MHYNSRLSTQSSDARNLFRVFYVMKSNALLHCKPFGRLNRGIHSRSVHSRRVHSRSIIGNVDTLMRVIRDAAGVVSSESNTWWQDTAAEASGSTSAGRSLSLWATTHTSITAHYIRIVGNAVVVWSMAVCVELCQGGTGADGKSSIAECVANDEVVAVLPVFKNLDLKLKRLEKQGGKG